jgi:hypothetical protein
MQGDREFHDAETGPQMATGGRDRIDHLGPEFRGQLRELGFAEGTEIGGNLDAIEEGLLRGLLGHRNCL